MDLFRTGSGGEGARVWQTVVALENSYPHFAASDSLGRGEMFASPLKPPCSIINCVTVSSCPLPTHPLKCEVWLYPELRFIQQLKQVANSSRYTGGTLCSVSSGSFRALVSDPGLVNTTKYNVSLYAVFLSRR